MDQQTLINILLSIATGAVSVGVLLLIGISKNVSRIDKNLAVLAESHKNIEKTVEKHDRQIIELQKSTS